MGIYNALFTGASGLSSFGEAVRVIGDNIANVNSLGFKSENVVFADVLSQTVNVSRSNIANQVGNGVRIGQITRDAQQGSVQSTTNATDMAINGRGMFQLKDPANGQTFYTRAGAFFLDKNFNLINGQGFVVQGWKTDTTATATGNVRDITFANLAAQASPTTKIDVGVSVDSNAVKPSATFNPNDAATYNYKTDVNIFDSLGSTHSVSTYFVKQGLNTSGQTAWDWHVAVAGNQLKGANSSTPTTPVEVSGGIYDINTPTIPIKSVLHANTVLSSDVKLDQTVTLPKGAITDQFGTTNIAAVIWTKGSTLASVLSTSAAGSLSSSGLFTLGSAITPSKTAQTVLSAGEIYMPSPTSIGNATTTVANGVITGSLTARNSTNGVKVNSNGVGTTISSDATTALGSEAIAFPAGSLQDQNGIVNANAISWIANTKLSTSVTGANSTMSPTGIYTLVGQGDLLSASSPVAYTGALPTAPNALNTGATLTGTTAVSTAKALTIPAGTLRDSAGATNTAAITLLAGGAALKTLTAAAGLSTTGSYTVISGV
ncbi:MAG: flagellar hook-basal body complex protein, partial [Mariprofundales bacterium]|nr:flagellar hook-basal body complex protein [Mariprofundales bacterium]